MSKIIKPVLAIGALALVFVPGLNAAAVGFLTTLGGTSFAAASVAAGIVSTFNVVGLGAAASLLSNALLPKVSGRSAANADRLRRTIDPNARPVIVFGETAMGTSALFTETHGSKKDQYTEILHVAAHRIRQVNKITLDDSNVWVTGSVDSQYTGEIAVTVVTEGSSGNAAVAGSGTYWTSAAKATGTAYVKTVYTVKAEGSRWANGIPTRMTIEGQGCPVYDPRLDSTRGGSGTCRVDDNTTWVWFNGGTSVYKNPALQLLTFMLGYKVGTVQVWGRFIDPNAINFASFIEAANLCEEGVALNGGGSMPRYQAGVAFNTSDSWDTVRTTLEAAMGLAKCTDVGGVWTLFVDHDDTSGPSLSLNEDDIVGGHVWTPANAMREFSNGVRGKFTNPAELYLMTDYPEVLVAALPDGANRYHELDLVAVQDDRQAQRIAKLYALYQQYSGVFQATFGPRAYLAEVGSLVRLSLASRGWDNKFFRVMEQTVSPALSATMTLQEVSPLIYSWVEEEAPLPTVVRPPGFDPVFAFAPENVTITPSVATSTSGLQYSIITVDWTVPSAGVAGIELFLSETELGTKSSAGMFDAYTGTAEVNWWKPGTTVWVWARYRMNLGTVSGFVGGSVSTSDAFLGSNTVLLQNVGTGGYFLLDTMFDAGPTVPGFYGTALTSFPPFVTSRAPAPTGYSLANLYYASGNPFYDSAYTVPTGWFVWATLNSNALTDVLKVAYGPAQFLSSTDTSGFFVLGVNIDKTITVPAGIGRIVVTYNVKVQYIDSLITGIQNEADAQIMASVNSAAPVVLEIVRFPIWNDTFDLLPDGTKISDGSDTGVDIVEKYQAVTITASMAVTAGQTIRLMAAPSCFRDIRWKDEQLLIFGVKS